MKIDIELSDNPYVTSQEKGINWAQRRVYEKVEVTRLKNEYKARIYQYMKVHKLAVPCLKGAVRLSVDYYFKTVDRKSWGKLKITKPDNDNTVKSLQDVLADLGFFYSGDQQVAQLVVTKRWASNARVLINIEEVDSDLFGT